MPPSDTGLLYPERLLTREAEITEAYVDDSHNWDQDVKGLVLLLAANPGQALGQTRLQRIEENKQAVTELIDYFIGYTVWLDDDLAHQIDRFITDLSRLLSEYEADLHEGQPSTDVGIAAAAQIEDLVHDAKAALDSKFREILEPPPWWDWPLRWFARLDATLRGRN